MAALSAGDEFDVLVVGGGATGLGVAVDAASRGHRVALVEAIDFAKGTSSRSTKLVHGGVRYLKQGNVALVLEALRERGRMARNAPHLVRDQAFVIPAYRWWEGPFYGIGMKVYDGLAGRLGLAPSQWLSKEETLARIPTVEPEGLDGGVVYYDGQFDDARMAVHLAMTAVDLGARVVNYARCVGLLKSADGQVIGATIRDEESGREFAVKAKAVVNATGVWVDELRQSDDAATKPVVAVSQGVHLVLPRRFLPGDAAVMVPKTSDGRVLFAVPWHDRVVVGTTDTARPAAAVEPRSLAEERDFLLEHARQYLAVDPTPEDVLSVFAGLRPLVKGGEGESTAALSRDHTVMVSPSGLITVTGGKWTTYRKMAEDVTDHVEMVGNLPERACVTVDLRIHGAGTDDARDKTVVDAYGTDRAAIDQLARDMPGGAELLHEDLPYSEAEVCWQVRAEMARTVEDVLARRTRALLLDARAAIACAPRVAAILAEELGRDEAWIAAQVEGFTTLARGYVFTDPASQAAEE
ncbi:glycerol-3-phosphate dehydrogenase/oxidase [Actomonas aquatica]|uniref:Glycerol-3-phosphate dehydrogenase/oxidase n=1 Tax=Actomonas aquatica TaxID=2866162 RepID=A0ABZ1C8W2_9BACT|nr:glycerol-3-phosphate dehydrogenase/oxidase [Opitutus sp. WL0086]WRQ88138.1 glycerol-3-phosphate dehydrogenase/oxidase [Opitutus sp. WL0086]